MRRIPLSASSRSARLGLLCAIAALLLIAPAAVVADETDQFTLPDRDEFADLGPYMNAVHYRVLEAVVDEANKKISGALRIDNDHRRQQALERLHGPAYLADKIRAIFGPGFFEMRNLESALRSRDAENHFGDLTAAYKTPSWIYLYTHLPVDPRRLVLLFQSSTIKIYGVYLGVDKIGHFHDLGHIYFKNYLSHRRGGDSHEEAVAKVVKTFSKGIISENAVIGSFATGVVSNADLASNYIGMKFFMNLLEPVMLEGREYPPLVVRSGAFYRLNEHVRPESDFMRPFFSDHWNEALNPSLYEWGMRGPIRDRLRKQADDILSFYAHEDGTPRTKGEFEQLYEELVTYYGEEYGHTGLKDDMVTIASACFDDEEEPETTDDSPATVASDQFETDEQVQR